MRLCVFGHHLNFFDTFFTLLFSELSLVGLSLEPVDYALSFCTVTLLVESSDP